MIAWSYCDSWFTWVVKLLLIILKIVVDSIGNIVMFVFVTETMTVSVLTTYDTLYHWSIYSNSYYVAVTVRHTK